MLCSNHALTLSMSKRFLPSIITPLRSIIIAPIDTIPHSKISPTHQNLRSHTTFPHNYPQQHSPIAEEILPPSPTQEDIANAIREHFSWRTPVIIRGAVRDTEAHRRWDNLEYLKISVGDDAHCEVEMGNGYNDPLLQKPRIPFESYIDYLRLFEEQFFKDETEGPFPKAEEMVYCAQNDVFDGLTRDFTIPQFCGDSSYNVGDGALYQSYLYLGPRGSMSPLHFDPLDNVIMQFVGYKRVLLYPQTFQPNNDEEVEDWYYKGEEGQQYNTSPIDVENPDFQKYPRFKMAPPAVEGYLAPGDMLYIPKKWWHHIRNLERCMSVNQFWH